MFVDRLIDGPLGTLGPSSGTQPRPLAGKLPLWPPPQVPQLPGLLPGLCLRRRDCRVAAAQVSDLVTSPLSILQSLLSPGQSPNSLAQQPRPQSLKPPLCPCSAPGAAYQSPTTCRHAARGLGALAHAVAPAGHTLPLSPGRAALQHLTHRALPSHRVSTSTSLPGCGGVLRARACLRPLVCPCV